MTFSVEANAPLLLPVTLPILSSLMKIEKDTNLVDIHAFYLKPSSLKLTQLRQLKSLLR